MARLRDESHFFPGVHSSNEILSPQPCAPPGKEHLLATFETSHVPHSDNGSATDGSRISSQDYEYNSSSSSNRLSTSDIFGREIDDELEHMKSRTSSRSSISSMPASVLIHPINDMKSMPPMNLHEKMVGYTIEESEASFGDFDDPPRSMRTIRPREAAFRKPSSVRAIQMHTEDEGEEDEYLTPPRRRAGMRSPGSSPVKRSPYYSPNTTTNKPKPKKDYPLVLLHCNLLAPSIPVPGASEPQNQEIVEEVLPPQYWKRWRRLQEKVGSGVLRDRGVLISHPEDLYDMLEERLLESLELQYARVHQGHFLGHEESNPESEGETSDQSESETDGEQGEECPDCGGRVLHQTDTNRKWEIRVFAANGLMRAGAWAAAWKEMEKVDVEVGLWLPSNVRRALEKRILEERASAPKEEPQGMLAICEAGTQDMDLRRLSVQGQIRSFSEAGSIQPSAPPEPAPVPAPEIKYKEPEHQIALGTLLINYIRVLASDKRNIALVIMSIAVAFLAFGTGPQQLQQMPAMQFFFQNGERLPFPASMEVPSPSLSVVSASIESLSIASSVMASPAIAFETPVQLESIPTSNAMGSVQASSPAEPSAIEDEPQPTETMDSSIEELEVDATNEFSSSTEAPSETQVSNAIEEPEVEPLDEADSLEVSEHEDPLPTDAPEADSLEEAKVDALGNSEDDVPLVTDALEQPVLASIVPEELTKDATETELPETAENAQNASLEESQDEDILSTDAAGQLVEDFIPSEVMQDEEAITTEEQTAALLE
ncbi:uncharacterized protein N7503_011959 [Penicillium pulvis]|uniref:uncharacterized protein n=1 Tax=Penicillium pulvis TaxID=1562058 RepID=UPI00254870E8|nr:uncharacterized protein N7503_011959 [Penicillium pulvis]KAJ5786747.1 hypothetical protein N7503_011959 [Penicillium pulvis]